MNKQPFRLGTGGDWGFRGGDRGQGTYTWRWSTMNKQPFRLGTGGGLGFWGWGPGTGDLYMEMVCSMVYNEQTTL